MNKYESFKPIDGKIEKSGTSLLTRLFSKLQSKPNVERFPETASSSNDSMKSSISEVPRHFSFNYMRDPASDNDLSYDETITWTKLLKTFKTNVSNTTTTSSENLPIKHKLNRVYWMPDSICHKCFFCEDEFTAIRRRHHCRMCGQVFCYRCCAFELPGSLWNQTKPQRSCHRCFQSYYSTSGHRKNQNLSAINLSSHDSSSLLCVENHATNSPTFSTRSEVSIANDQNLYQQNKSLSFSSNDVSSNKLYNFSEHHAYQSEESDILTTLKRNSSVPEFDVVKCDPIEVKAERKVSPGKLNPKFFIQNHFLKTNITQKVVTQLPSVEPQYSQKVQKEILLMVWKRIIEETERLRIRYFNKVKIQVQTRSIESQFSFPEEDSLDFDALDMIFTNTVNSKSCINGVSLVNWISNKCTEVKDRFHAVAICQSYLEMQLIFPYFIQEGYSPFRDDNTMYVIRECTSDYSPRSTNKEYDRNYFTDFELMGYLSSNSLQKSYGNSTFYKDDDYKSNDSDVATLDTQPVQYPSAFTNIHADQRFDGSNDTFYQKSTTNLWNRSCEYLEKLLKQELRDYNLDISWCNILLPNCKMISETISPNIFDVKSTNNIRNYVQIKKIPDSQIRECQIIFSVSISKNVDFSVMREIRNPGVILIRASIDYWRHRKLVSLDPLILQEEEYLRNCVRKIVTLKPDIVVVEGNVSLIAKELLEISGLILISNVRKVQMEKLARMLGTTIFDSVDSLGGNVEVQLGRCSQFNVEKFKLSNGRHKYLLFFKLFNNSDGCTLLLRSTSLSELVRVKYITQFMIVAFRNAFLELACLKNFQIRFLGSKGNSSQKAFIPSNEQSTDSSFALLDIIDTRTIPISPNVYYLPPICVTRSFNNPELQSRLLSLDMLNVSWKEKLHDVLKRKQRHICAEQYDELRMKTRRHPLMQEPVIHSFLNCYNDRELSANDLCILYSDFRNNGSRFKNVNLDIENSLNGTLHFDSSDVIINGGFLTRDQESRFRDLEKKQFESIWESFNPRNYTRILLLYSIQTPIGICEKPRKISLSYYEGSDKTLGNFVTSMLSDTSTCPIKCESSFFDHVYKFVHNGGSIEVSVHHMESDSHRKLLNTICPSDNAEVSDIKIWNWCSRCDKTLGLREMSHETWNLSLGRFFDLLFNMNSSDTSLVPGQCSHSLQNDVHYYFTKNSSSRALEIKYVAVTIYEFQTPDLFININNNKSTDDLFKTFKVLQKEIEKVTEVKTKYNLEIKAKIMKLKAESKVEDSELWDFLQQDSNTDQYSEAMESIYNLMEDIYDSANNNFNVELFKSHERIVTENIIHLWIDIVNFVSKWDQKLNEAFEREEKDKKQTKLESKMIKNSNEDLIGESDVIVSKSCVNPILMDLNNQDIKSNVFLKTISTINDSTQDTVDLKKKFLWSSLEDKNVQFVPPTQLELRIESRPSSRASTSDNLDNNGDGDYVMVSKEKFGARESDLKLLPHTERLTGSTASNLTRKLFPSFFNTNNLKVLIDPTSPDCSYVFPDIWSLKEAVVVKDDSITSVIGFALSSNIYHDKLNEMIHSAISKPNMKPESFLAICPAQENKLTSDIGHIDGFNNVNMIPSEDCASTKNRCQSATVEIYPKDHLCVRYLNRPEVDEQNDFVEMQSYECGKIENEEIKIEVSSEEVISEDMFQKPPISAKIPNNNNNNPKKVPKCDFEISFSNHKVKCFCRIYNALQFHKLREEVLGSNQQSFIRSLSECKHWVTTGGKSGLKFRKTMDDRYIIKQLHPMELNGFRKFHEKYFEYILERIQKKEKCVLAKILGIYHVDYSNSVTKFSEKLDFLVMENLFYNQKPSKIFDLKGNKQIAVNPSLEKVIASDTSVMQDKDFISYSRSKPIYVSWQTQIALKETLTRDTDFLKGLPVMDYSLLVGVDDENQVLVIGIIDYLRMFTIDKLIEMHFKQKLLTPHGELPTVIQPQRYQKRFLEAMEEYFLICPIPWDCLLLYPTIPPNVGATNVHSTNITKVSGSTFYNHTQKVAFTKRAVNNYVDENELRCARFESF